MNTKPLPLHPHYLHALDGLRFFAALFVACAHLSVSLFKVAPQPEAVGYISSFAGIGMTLFFVLSGFVIHYNYHTGSEGWTKKSLGYFALARFSRLYPLFFIVVLLDVYFARLAFPENFSRASLALPYYLTMTHSWFYTVIGNNSLIYQFAYFSAVSWSISVEIFLYLIYIPLALWLVRIRRVQSLLLIGVAAYVLFFIGASIFMHYYADLNSWGAERFGPVADSNNGYQDSLVRWLIYFAPFVRLMEFLLGCIAAKLVLHYQDTPPRLSTGVVGWLSFVVIIACIAAHLWIYKGPGVTTQAKSQIYAPLIALLIYLVARFQSPVEKFLGSKAMRWGGDASYSIYMLHFFVIRSYGQPNIASDAGLNHLLALKGVILLIVILALSRLCYLGFEFPCKELLRRRMSFKQLPQYLMNIAWKSRYLIIFFMVIANILFYLDKIIMSGLN